MQERNFCCKKIHKIVQTLLLMLTVANQYAHASNQLSYGSPAFLSDKFNGSGQMNLANALKKIIPQDVKVLFMDVDPNVLTRWNYSDAYVLNVLTDFSKKYQFTWELIDNKLLIVGQRPSTQEKPLNSNALGQDQVTQNYAAPVARTGQTFPKSPMINTEKGPVEAQSQGRFEIRLDIYVGALSGISARSANLFSGLIALGANAAVPVSVLNNAINLGANTTAQNSKMVIGDANLVHLHVGNLASWFTTSDGRLKDNIRPSTLGLNFVRQLKPKAYTMKSSVNARLGFIAQEVEDVAPHFQGLSKPRTRDEYYALNYEAFIAPLAKSIQELDDTLKHLEPISPAVTVGVGLYQPKVRGLGWAFQIIEALMALNIFVFVVLQFKCWSKFKGV